MSNLSLPFEEFKIGNESYVAGYRFADLCCKLF